jgi:hypothetical protein
VLEDFKKKFLQPKEKEKKIMQHTIEKKNIMQKRALKKILTCKSTHALQSSLQYCVHRLGLQDFAFLSRHICLKEDRVNSGQNHRDSTAFGASNIYDNQWRSLAKLLPPPEKIWA